jgi:polar amino acid transport system permease protein
MNFDLSIVMPYWRVLATGLLTTILYTLVSAVVGSLLGFILSVVRSSPNRILNTAAMLYVEFFRGTPLLIQLFWIFFCLPVVFNVALAPYQCVFISMMLYMAAITCETFRGSMKSIGSEQHDACTALGLASATKVCYVIFPQTLLRAIPPLLSNVVSLFKESALISSVGIADLMFVSQSIANTTARPLEFLSAAAIIYFAVAFPLTRAVGLIEGKMLRKLNG